MNPFHTFPNASDDHSDKDRERGHRHLGPLAALVVAVLAVTLLGPRVVSGLSNWLQHDRTAASATPLPLQPNATVGGPVVTPPPSATPTAAVTIAEAPASTVAAIAAPTTTPSAPASVSSTSTSTSAPVAAQAPSAPAAEVTLLQTVPPIRDLVIRINGKTLTSDGSGSIPLSEPNRHGTVEIVGLVSTPALQQVEFSGWSDGTAAAARSLDAMVGPVAQIGLVVSNRVVATMSPKSPSGGTVQFTSAAGALQLDLDQPTWVATARAVAVDAGLATQSLTYTATTLTDKQSGSATPVPLAPQNYVAAPEALWLIAR